MTRNAKEVPKVAWEYHGLVSFMFENPGLYTTDEMRRDCHERLCKRYGISKESSRSVTDNLDKYEDAVEMHEALLEIYRKVDKKQSDRIPKCHFTPMEFNESDYESWWECKHCGHTKSANGLLDGGYL